MLSPELVIVKSTCQDCSFCFYLPMREEEQLSRDGYVLLLPNCVNLLFVRHPTHDTLHLLCIWEKQPSQIRGTNSTKRNGFSAPYLKASTVTQDKYGPSGFGPAICMSP